MQKGKNYTKKNAYTIGIDGLNCGTGILQVLTATHVLRLLLALPYLVSAAIFTSQLPTTSSLYSLTLWVDGHSSSHQWMHWCNTSTFPYIHGAQLKVSYRMHFEEVKCLASQAWNRAKYGTI